MLQYQRKICAIICVLFFTCCLAIVDPKRAVKGIHMQHDYSRVVSNNPVGLQTSHNLYTYPSEQDDHQVPIYSRSGSYQHSTQTFQSSQHHSGGGAQGDLQGQSSIQNQVLAQGYPPGTISQNSGIYATECPPNYSGAYPYALDCQKFLNCWKGTGTVQPCGPGTAFNAELLQCDNPKNVQCHVGSASGLHQQFERLQITSPGAHAASGGSVNCPSGASGLYPHSYDCSKFLNCANGVTTIQDCGPGTVFNSKISACDWPQSVDCGTRRIGGTSESIVAESSQVETVMHPGPYTDHDHAYYISRNLKCPYYHGDLSALSTTYSGQTVTSHSQTGHLEVSPGGHQANTHVLQTSAGGSVNCPSGASGLYPHSYDCSKFLNCANGVTTIQDCGPGTVFNPKISACDWPQSVDCGTRRIGGTSETVVAESTHSQTVVHPGAYQDHDHAYYVNRGINCPFSHGEGGAYGAQTTTVTGSYSGTQGGLGQVTTGTAGHYNSQGGGGYQQTSFNQHSSTTTIGSGQGSTGHYQTNVPSQYGTSHTTTSQTGQTVKCPPSVSGLHPHPYDCAKYLSCANGVTSLRDCGPGTVFNPVTSICDWPSSVDCGTRRIGGSSETVISQGTQSHAATQPGVYQDHDHAYYVNRGLKCPFDHGDSSQQVHGTQQQGVQGHYITSQTGTTTTTTGFGQGVSGHSGSTQDRPYPGYQVNTQGQVTQTNQNVGHTGQVPVSSGSVTGGYYRPGTHGDLQGQPSISNSRQNEVTAYATECPPNYTGVYPYALDCRRFLNCWKGRGHVQACGPGTAFNAETLECDHPGKVRCHVGSTGNYPQPSERLEVTSPGAHTVNQPVSPGATTAFGQQVKCPPDASGPHPHPYDCAKFLNCDGGRTHVQDCGPGTVFNPLIRNCDWPSSVDCGSKTIGGTQDSTVVETFQVDTVIQPGAYHSHDHEFYVRRGEKCPFHEGDGEDQQTATTHKDESFQIHYHAPKDIHHHPSSSGSEQNSDTVSHTHTEGMDAHEHRPHWHGPHHHHRVAVAMRPTYPFYSDSHNQTTGVSYSQTAHGQTQATWPYQGEYPRPTTPPAPTRWPVRPTFAPVPTNSHQQPRRNETLSDREHILPQSESRDNGQVQQTITWNQFSDDIWKRTGWNVSNLMNSSTNVEIEQATVHKLPGNSTTSTIYYTQQVENSDEDFDDLFGNVEGGDISHINMPGSISTTTPRTPRTYTGATTSPNSDRKNVQFQVPIGTFTLPERRGDTVPFSSNRHQVTVSTLRTTTIWDENPGPNTASQNPFTTIHGNLMPPDQSPTRSSSTPIYAHSIPTVPAPSGNYLPPFVKSPPTISNVNTPPLQTNFGIYPANTVAEQTLNPSPSINYSPSYSGVAHSRDFSRNTNSITNTSHIQTPVINSNPGTKTNPALIIYNRDEVRVIPATESSNRTNLSINYTRTASSLPPPYNQGYYSSSSYDEIPQQTPDVGNLPISEALKALLRPYFPQNGTVTEDVVSQMDEHIMRLSKTTPRTVEPPPDEVNDTETIFTVEQNALNERTRNVPERHYRHHHNHNFTHHPHMHPPHNFTHHPHRHHHNFTHHSHRHHHHHNSTHFPHPPHHHLPHDHSHPPHSHFPHQHNHSHAPHPNMEQTGDGRWHNRDFHNRHPHLNNPFATTTSLPEIVETTTNWVPTEPNVPVSPSRPTPLPFPINQTDRYPDLEMDIDPRFNTFPSTDGGQQTIIPNPDSNDCSTGFNCQNGRCINLFEVCDGVNNCGNRLDEGSCNHLGYEVRLSNDENENHLGRVEVKINGRWGYVCDDKFGLRDADVLCRELGFPLGASEVRANSFYPPHVEMMDANNEPYFVMDEVDCIGNETSLKNCDFKGWGVHDCTAEEVVGVVCKIPVMKCPNDYWLCTKSQECIPPAFVCDNVPDCADNSDESQEYCNSTAEYRLVDGETNMEGRVEVKFRGSWGTVCDDDFEATEAQVVCRTLGYYGTATVVKNTFGPGTGPIWLDQLQCSGSETSLDKCSHWAWGKHNCNHTEDVSVRCSQGPRPTFPAVATGVKGGGTQSPIRLTDDTEMYIYQIERSSKQLPPDVLRCGQVSRNLPEMDPNEEYMARIIRGTRARRGNHPWQATIRAKARSGRSTHWCGAVLISEIHVLTAAHCLVGFAKGAYFVRLGDHFSEIAESSEIDVFIENWYIHEDFRKGQHMNNDIALLVLKSPVQFNDYIQPACLPAKGASLLVGSNCTISGWGSIESGSSTPANDLRYAKVPILSKDVCSQPIVYGGAITDGMFCAGYLDESVDACEGDSGGPLVCTDQGAETLYGIISWGQHCGFANKPGVYSNVVYFLDWILEKMRFSVQLRENN